MKESITLQEASELRLFMIADNYTASQISKEMQKYTIEEPEENDPLPICELGD